MSNPTPAPTLINWRLDVAAADIVLRAVSRLSIAEAMGLFNYLKSSADAQVAEHEAAVKAAREAGDKATERAAA